MPGCDNADNDGKKEMSAKELLADLLKEAIWAHRVQGKERREGSRLSKKKESGSVVK